jgi:diguanylate cyclase (GGDEF)-like protein
MNTKLVTRADLLRRTVGIVALSVGATLVLGWLMTITVFGIDPDASVRVGYVTACSLAMGAILSAVLAGGLSYRSGRLLQQLTRTQEELLRVARTDQLTGLQNRRGFDEAASAALAEASESRLSAVALMCDIDHFKAINDRFGHEFGDAVLAQLGEVLQAFAAENGILVARHGGEEFAALMIGVTIDQAALYAEGLRQMCAVKEISHKGTSIHVTVSVGVAASRDETDLSRLKHAADDALYAAKRRGRNCVVRTEIDALAA